LVHAFDGRFGADRTATVVKKSVLITRGEPHRKE